MEETRDANNLALGSAVRQLRKEAGLTQQELADKAGVPAEKLRQIESGGVDADWGTLRQLAYALDTALPELFRLTEELAEG